MQCEHWANATEPQRLPNIVTGFRTTREQSPQSGFSYEAGPLCYWVNRTTDDVHGSR